MKERIEFSFDPPNEGGVPQSSHSSSLSFGSGGEPPPDFVSRDVGETQAWLTTLLGRKLSLEPTNSESFEARVTGRPISGATIVNARYPHGMRLQGAATSDNLTLHMVTRGSARCSVGSRPFVVAAGYSLILNTAMAKASIFDEASSHRAFSIKADEVARTLEQMFDRPVTGGLDIATLVDTNTSDGALAANLMHSMEACLHNENNLVRAPHAQRMLRDALIMLILERFPHRYSPWFDREEADPAPRQIRRAIEYIDTHISGPLTAQDVAEAVGIGVRALQKGFRLYKDTSPHAYLKSVRLKCVRAELLDPESTRSISDIACHWGFPNRGHFALDYFKVFGEQPSQTRRRR